MPRAPRVPSYRLHKPTGQAVVTLSGHDHYLGRHGTPASRQKYARLIAEWSALGGSVPPRGPDLSVSEVLAAYYAFAKSYYVKGGEPTRQIERVRRALAPARDLYGDTPAARFGPVALKACRAEYVRQGWCRRLVNQSTSCLARAFKWACAEELVPPELYHGLASVEGLKKGRTEAPESPPVLPAPEAAIEAALPGLSPVLADVVRVQLLTGARPGEALSLRAGELDRGGDVWLWRPASHKTEHLAREKVLFVGPRCQALLAPYLLRRGDAYLFSPAESVRLYRERARAARRTPVQPSQQDRSVERPRRRPGERYLRTSYARAVAKACARAGCEHWHPHQLRHNAATRLAEQFGWEVTRIILGHRSIDTTRLYAEDAVRKAVDAMRQVG